MSEGETDQDEVGLNYKEIRYHARYLQFCINNFDIVFLQYTGVLRSRYMKRNDACDIIDSVFSWWAYPEINPDSWRKKINSWKFTEEDLIILAKIRVLGTVIPGSQCPCGKCPCDDTLAENAIERFYRYRPRHR